MGAAFFSYKNGMLDTTWVGIALGTIILMLVATLVEALQETSHRLKVVNDSLRRAEAEKDILIRENAHRVRNDLTTFSSVIRLQQARLVDPVAKDALGALNERLLVLVKVHNRLRIDAGHTLVNSREFLNDLGEELRTSLIGTRAIRLVVNAESYPLTHRSAVALGIIMNEFLTNALKYAFQGRKTGEVVVTFAREDRTFILNVRDDGVGHDGTVKGTGLGMNLIRGMVRQLDGALSFDKPSQGGYVATVRFSAADVLATSLEKTETP